MEKPNLEVSQKLICMAKVQNFSGISPDLPFTEFDFYELYRRTFETSELGKIRKRLPLREMAENFGLTSKSIRAKKGRKPYFTPEGKVALMFLKMYTGLSSPKLMEHLNGNVHYQLFCDVRIDPMHPLTNYKLLDDVFSELARGLKIQQQQEILARAWKPYMKDLDTMYTDATCYESEMRYPTDPKLLWEGIEKSYEIMCTLSAKLNVLAISEQRPQKTDDYFGVKPPKKDPIINKKGRELGSRASIFRSIATQLS